VQQSNCKSCPIYWHLLQQGKKVPDSIFETRLLNRRVAKLEWGTFFIGINSDTNGHQRQKHSWHALATKKKVPHFIFATRLFIKIKCKLSMNTCALALVYFICCKCEYTSIHLEFINEKINLYWMLLPLCIWQYNHHTHICYKKSKTVFIRPCPRMRS
jgi:hypothetical protein